LKTGCWSLTILVIIRVVASDFDGVIVIAVINRGHLQSDHSGARPGSSGLLRLIV
jgi:hypothetical protein